MPRILIERARQKPRPIHGGAPQRWELHPDLAAAPEPDEEPAALDTAPSKLGQQPHPCENLR